MTYRGTISNGVVVFSGPDRPGEGTEVEVRPVGASLPESHAGAGSGRTLDDIAREQGVTDGVRFEALLGGWPQGEEADGFEDAVAGPPPR